MKCLSLALFPFLLFSCSSASIQNRSNLWPKRVIDAHVHVTYSGKKSELTGFEVTEAEFQRQLQEVNGRGAIAHTNRKMDQTRDYSSLRIVPCLGITKDPDLKRIERGLKNKDYRCVKVYLGYEYQYAAHPKYKSVYRLAEKYNIPVVFHTGDTYDVDGHLKYADPLTIDEVAVEFRKVKFVIAHIGNPWIQSAAEVAYKNENVYLDVSALLIGKLLELPAEQVEKYVVEPIRWVWGYVENPKKMMFATDWPLVRIKDYVEITKRAVPFEYWDRFFYLNAAEVFGFESLYPWPQPEMPVK